MSEPENIGKNLDQLTADLYAAWLATKPADPTGYGWLRHLYTAWHSTTSPDNPSGEYDAFEAFGVALTHGQLAVKERPADFALVHKLLWSEFADRRSEWEDLFGVCSIKILKVLKPVKVFDGQNVRVVPSIDKPTDYFWRVCKRAIVNDWIKKNPILVQASIDEDTCHGEPKTYALYSDVFNAADFIADQQQKESRDFRLQLVKVCGNLTLAKFALWLLRTTKPYKVNVRRAAACMGRSEAWGWKKLNQLQRQVKRWQATSPFELCELLTKADKPRYQSKSNREVA